MTGVQYSAVRAKLAGIILVTAEGVNSTSGYSTELVAISSNELEFINTPPSGITLQVITPFLVTAVVADQGQKEVTVKYNDDSEQVAVTDPGVVQSAMINEIFLTHGVSPESTRKFVTSGQSVSVANICYEDKLAVVDIPFGCATWSDPLRAKRYSFLIRICGPDEGKARKALEECLRDSAIVALLVALTTPIGWAGAWPAFKTSLAACITGKLSSSFSVDLWKSEECR